MGELSLTPIYTLRRSKQFNPPRNFRCGHVSGPASPGEPCDLTIFDNYGRVHVTEMSGFWGWNQVKIVQIGRRNRTRLVPYNITESVLWATLDFR